MTARLLTVLVPAYRPDRIVETVQSLADQGFQDFVVRVGYDRADDYEPPDLPRAQFDLDVVQHPRRMGWVGNANALLATVDTPYFVVVAHDDTLSQTFLADAVEAMEREPDAVVVHGVTEHRGMVRAGEVSQTDAIVGSAFERMSEFIRRGPHRAELGWRGLIRREALPTVPHLRTRLSDGQFSNTLFALELLCYGESVSLDGIRYIKNTSSKGLSRDLVSRSADAKSRMLADNLACLADALAAAGDRLDLDQREHLLTEYAHWLLKLQGPWNILADEKDSSRRKLRDVRGQVASFVARALLSSVSGHARPTDETPASERRSS
ncbi:glycosyltransferase family 2 protein [Silicimonas algicola]|uniref:Glycosyl transferase family 2 n=1 Tax=Silicimonas algicola TaxID=1826607 RepID=A0A316G4M6_9RHOB|nr:glycosyltransferase [Silicimonas algicola]PWK55849.1 glycosyl transferase family 2 [Silicimonas algicola]